MSDIRLPQGFRFERLGSGHRRNAFCSGQADVDDWFTTKALQNQAKHLSSTKVLLNGSDEIAGFFSLVTGQVDFSELPPDLRRKLPKRMLPVAVLAWLGVAANRQGYGFGRLLLVRALRDCFEAEATFPFVAVVLDCVGETAKAFYQRFDFAELPGQPSRLYLSTAKLEGMMSREA